MNETSPDEAAREIAAAEREIAAAQREIAAAQREIAAAARLLREFMQSGRSGSVTIHFDRGVARSAECSYRLRLPEDRRS